MKLPVIKLDASLRDSLRAGHPWVYRNHVEHEPNYESGTWVEVRAGTWSAIGLWDADSAIAIRLWSRSQLPDARWVRNQLRVAWAARAPLREQQTTAYRCLFGENEGLPGITIDLYESYAVIRTYAASLDAVVPWVVDALRAELPVTGILLRRFAGDETQESAEFAREPALAGQKVQLLWGTLPPPDLVVLEHGLRFRANLLVGQKTGLFLDHRENRQFLAGWAAGRSMLNCFAYTGAFGVYALRGGATTITSCDLAAAAAEEAAVNLELNGFDPAQHPFIVGDCFDLLTDYAQKRRMFDVVVLDPPSFAHSRRQLPAAIRAYTKLNTLALQTVAPGGLLATASCTAQLSPDAFQGLLAQAAQAAQRRLLIVHEAGQPLDHPVAAHFPEGRYLKFVLARVLPLP